MPRVGFGNLQENFCDETWVQGRATDGEEEWNKASLNIWSCYFREWLSRRGNP